MDTPGYDPVSATGQIACGAHLVCFTTSRGSCFCSVPAPTVKLASNTPMYERMVSDMEINCATFIQGDAPTAEMGAQIFQQLLRHASGEDIGGDMGKELGISSVELGYLFSCRSR